MKCAALSNSLFSPWRQTQDKISKNTPELDLKTSPAQIYQEEMKQENKSVHFSQSLQSDFTSRTWDRRTPGLPALLILTTTEPLCALKSPLKLAHCNLWTSCLKHSSQWSSVQTDVRAELHSTSTNEQQRRHYTTNQYSTPNATMVNLQPAEQMRAFGQMCTYSIKTHVRNKKYKLNVVCGFFCLFHLRKVSAL